MSLTVLIPAYNEEGRIERTLKHLVHSFSSVKGLEILVVFDGNDKTGNIVSRYKEKTRKNIKLYTYKHRLGKWGALKEGIKKAKNGNIIFVDADEAIPSADVKRLYSVFEKSGCDLLIASRYMKSSKILVRQSARRIFFSRLFNMINNILFNLSFRDTQCGCKIFKREKIFEVIKKMKATGFEGDVEFLWLAKKLGRSIMEEPVTWMHQEKSKFRLRNGFKMLSSLLKIRFSG